MTTHNTHTTHTHTHECVYMHIPELQLHGPSVHGEALKGGEGTPGIVSKGEAHEAEAPARAVLLHDHRALHGAW